MLSPEVVEFGISALVGAAVALTTSRYGLSLRNPETRTNALLVSGACLVTWMVGIDLIFH